MRAGRIASTGSSRSSASTGVAADVSTEEGRAALVAEVRRLGRLDWLVNNAGTGGGTAGLDVDVARARRVLEPNFYAHVALTQELWPLLRESPQARVIVVSSSLGTYSSSGSITYGASKAALTSWGRALAVAAKPLGIEVTLVNPGPVVTTTFPHTSCCSTAGGRRPSSAWTAASRTSCAPSTAAAARCGRTRLFRVPAVVQAIAPATFDRFFV